MLRSSKKIILQAWRLFNDFQLISTNYIFLLKEEQQGKLSNNSQNRKLFGVEGSNFFLSFFFCSFFAVIILPIFPLPYPDLYE